MGASTILAFSRNYYSDNTKIREYEDDYDAGEEWNKLDMPAIQTAAEATTETSMPESFLIELKATAMRESQNVIQSTVNNYNSVATTPTSIYDFQVNKIVVRPEEAFIVILVIVLWIGAILLFIHRWGKIRMLEPYAPKFEEAIHRPSCGPLTFEAIATKRMSLGVMSIQCGPASWNQSTLNLNRGLKHPFSRPRLNSVFVGPHLFSPPQPPRKTKSAFDIHSLMEAECEV